MAGVERQAHAELSDPALAAPCPTARAGLDPGLRHGYPGTGRPCPHEDRSRGNAAAGRGRTVAAWTRSAATAALWRLALRRRAPEPRTLADQWSTRDNADQG